MRGAGRTPHWRSSAGRRSAPAAPTPLASAATWRSWCGLLDRPGVHPCRVVDSQLGATRPVPPGIGTLTPGRVAVPRRGVARPVELGPHRRAHPGTTAVAEYRFTRLVHEHRRDHRVVLWVPDARARGKIRHAR